MKKFWARKVELTKYKQQIICMMMALPESYHPLGQNLSMIPNLTAEQARNQLLEERRQRSQKQERSKATTRRGGHGGGGGGQCPHCHRNMHPEAECWDLHRELEPEWYQKKK